MRRDEPSARRRVMGLALGCVLAIASVGLTGGCMSITIPLPPPSRPTVSPPDASGLSTISGVVQSQATAYVENLATGRIAGQVTGDSGRYSVELETTVGDVLHIWYQLGVDESDWLEIQVPATDGELPPISLGGASGN